MSLDFQAFLFWACYRMIRFVTCFWHKTGTFLERFLSCPRGEGERFGLTLRTCPR